MISMRCRNVHKNLQNSAKQFMIKAAAEEHSAPREKTKEDENDGFF